MSKDVSRLDMTRDLSKNAQEKEEDEKAQEEEIRDNMRVRRDTDYSKTKVIAGPQLKSQKEKLLENIVFYKNIMKYEKKIAEKLANRVKVNRTRRVTSIPGRKLFSNEKND